MSSLPETRFTRLVGCRLPLQQAGMGGVSTAALAASVAGEGGLGMLAASGLGPEAVAVQVAEVRVTAGSDARVGVNFLVPFLDPAALDAAAQVADVVECFYGDPDPAVVARARGGGGVVAWQVGSADEARAAEEAGCDILVVQGVEAGGHVRGTTPLRTLLGEVRPVTDLPLVAAGGIGSGRALADVLTAGADAARLGTVLLAAGEADVHPDYLAALVAAGADDTVLAEAFSFGWPEAPHRVLRSCIDASDADPATRSPMPPTRATASAEVPAAALYAGTSVADLRGAESAAAIVQRIVREAAAALAST